MTDPTRGVLYPERLPRFTRREPQDAASALVAWFWIPEWDLPDGAVSRHVILGYPAANLVVEPDGVTLWGPTTTATERELRGRGWAVGAVLRPAAFARLHRAPSELVDRHVALEAPELQRTVAEAMSDLEAVTTAVAAWLAEHVGPPTPEGRLANAMADLLMTVPGPVPREAGASREASVGVGPAAVLRVDDAAERLRVSVRTLQRLAHRTVGVSPAAMIRRRRLQEAAQRVRDDPCAPLADIAAELGYADQAHLANDFRAVLGFSASQYRETR